jgi:putative Mn2+ efflux pump MntP
MSYITITGIAAGLAMDAFAVSISYGCRAGGMAPRNTITIALFFGLFQAFMPVIGWFAGSSFASLINSYDHWAAFAILLYIGTKMIYEGLKSDGDSVQSCEDEFKLGYKRLFILSIATSIDALAVGLSLALIDYPIAGPAAVIGIITFIFSYIGVKMGCRLNSLLGRKVEIFGGVILILIGIKIVMEHWS